jgi:hypothetical protein
MLKVVGAWPTRMRHTGGVADAEQSTLQVVMDQLEELVVTLIEEIRERPGVAAAIGAAVVGALVGGMLAALANRRAAARDPKPVRRTRQAGQIAGFGLRLLKNPIVRAIVIAQLRRRVLRI